MRLNCILWVCIHWLFKYNTTAFSTCCIHIHVYENLYKLIMFIGVWSYSTNGCTEPGSSLPGNSTGLSGTYCSLKGNLVTDQLTYRIPLHIHVLALLRQRQACVFCFSTVVAIFWSHYVTPVSHWRWFICAAGWARIHSMYSRMLTSQVHRQCHTHSTCTFLAVTFIFFYSDKCVLLSV